MPELDRTDPRLGFFEPFFETGAGHIIGLATERGDLRDGLALTQIARYFPLPEFENVRVEPSRPTISVAANLILVGSGVLFLEPVESEFSGEKPLPVGRLKLGERLESIYRRCCYRFARRRGARALENSVTGEAHSSVKEGADWNVDFGVVRRLFSGPLQNTVILEGSHRLGTLGAVKVATDRRCLRLIWEAVQELPAFKHSLPLEILVRASRRPDSDDAIQSLRSIAAEPLAVVYDRSAFYDLKREKRWIDQRPWSIHLLVQGTGRPRAAGEQGAPLPKLEVEADLQDLARADRALLRRLTAAALRPDARPPEPAVLDPLLRRVTAEADRFRLELVHRPPWFTQPSVVSLPRGSATPIRRVRKQFLVHLILRRLFGVRFVYDDRTVRENFPEFESASRTRSHAGQFVGTVAGKLREGFEPLLGKVGNPTGYMIHDCKRGARAYELKLQTATLVVKLRL